MFDRKSGGKNGKQKAATPVAADPKSAADAPAPAESAGATSQGETVTFTPRLVDAIALVSRRAMKAENFGAHGRLNALEYRVGALKESIIAALPDADETLEPRFQELLKLIG